MKPSVFACLALLQLQAVGCKRQSHVGAPLANVSAASDDVEAGLSQLAIGATAQNEYLIDQYAKLPTIGLVRGFFSREKQLIGLHAVRANDKSKIFLLLPEGLFQVDMDAMPQVDLQSGVTAYYKVSVRFADAEGRKLRDDLITMVSINPVADATWEIRDHRSEAELAAQGFPAVTAAHAAPPTVLTAGPLSFAKLHDLPGLDVAGFVDGLEAKIRRRAAYAVTGSEDRPVAVREQASMRAILKREIAVMAAWESTYRSLLEPAESQAIQGSLARLASEVGL